MNPRLTTLAATFPAPGDAAAAIARWSDAAGADARLMTDLIRLGGVLALQPDTFVQGMAQRDPIDLTRLAYEAGARDLAVRLLTLMSFDDDALRRLMEMNDDR